jgi:hypothetical protein
MSTSSWAANENDCDWFLGMMPIKLQTKVLVEKLYF